jgi:hypothetical protein
MRSYMFPKMTQMLIAESRKKLIIKQQNVNVRFKQNDNSVINNHGDTISNSSYGNDNSIYANGYLSSLSLPDKNSHGIGNALKTIYLDLLSTFPWGEKRQAPSNKEYIYKDREIKRSRSTGEKVSIGTSRRASIQSTKSGFIYPTAPNSALSESHIQRSDTNNSSIGGGMAVHRRQSMKAGVTDLTCGTGFIEGSNSGSGGNASGMIMQRRASMKAGATDLTNPKPISSMSRTSSSKAKNTKDYMSEAVAQVELRDMQSITSAIDEALVDVTIGFMGYKVCYYAI